MIAELISAYVASSVVAGLIKVCCFVELVVNYVIVSASGRMPVSRSVIFPC